MIILDLETSGIDFVKCGIWQIGAIDLETNEDFFGECRIDDDDTITEESLKVTGKTEAELRNKKKQSQKELLESFFRWVEKRKVKTLVCEGPQFDWTFLTIKARKYNLEIPYHYRAFDLHSLAQAIYYKKNNKFLIKDSHSDLGLKNTLEFLGLKDERIALKDGKVVKEGKPHNALEDAKLEAECFRRLLKMLKEK